MSIRNFVVAATLAAGALATGTAHAGPDVQWQVSVETPRIRLPGHVVLPLPPILVPRAVVVAPREQRVYYGYNNPRWDRDGDGIPNRYDARPDDPRNGRGWHEREYRREHWHDDRCDDRRESRRDERWDNRRDWRDDRRH